MRWRALKWPLICGRASEPPQRCRCAAELSVLRHIGLRLHAFCAKARARAGRRCTLRFLHSPRLCDSRAARCAQPAADGCSAGAAARRCCWTTQRVGLAAAGRASRGLGRRARSRADAVCAASPLYRRASRLQRCACAAMDMLPPPGRLRRALLPHAELLLVRPWERRRSPCALFVSRPRVLRSRARRSSVMVGRWLAADATRTALSELVGASRSCYKRYSGATW